MSDRQSVHLAELVSALSYALDLTEGQPVGHSVRACWIGVHIGMEIGLTLRIRLTPKIRQQHRSRQGKSDLSHPNRSSRSGLSPSIADDSLRQKRIPARR